MNVAIEKNVSLQPFSTIKIGGAAKYFCVVKDRFSFRDILKKAEVRQIPVFVLGKGSNLFFSDQGFDGLVIVNKIDTISYENQVVTVGSGYSFANLGRQVSKKGYSGLEFAAGIPGSVGGAVYMNAGACGQQVSDVLISCMTLSKDGKFHNLEKEDMDFGYRSSVLQKDPQYVVEAKFSIQPDSAAQHRMDQMREHRLETQPYEENTCGCVFQNPEGASAGELIEKSGLKGFRMGRLCVSKKHANFFVNEGEATAQNMLDLIAHVRNTVQQKTGVALALEARYIDHRGEVCV